MRGFPARTQGIVAAGLAAILTLSVFANATYTGPESTIYEYHYGILAREPETVRDASLQDPKSGPARELLSRIAALLAAGAEFEVRGVQSHGRDAIVLVVYSSPRLGALGVQFHLHKSRSRWLVDAVATVGAMSVRAPFLVG